MGNGGGCWCGEGAGAPFGAGYLECPACGTLRRSPMPDGDVTRVRDESADLYGRDYWFAHQAELGLPDLVTRARSDLGERCLHWLRTILAYRPPTGRALEIGAAHGGFVALLGEAGFTACGLELSPWVVGYARRTFGVEMVQGPLEDLELAPGSFDLVCLTDVLEHLPDPLATLHRAAALLTADGVLFLQTPCRPPARSLAELEADGERFVEMLLPEHLFLFTRRSLAALVGRAGLSEIAFEEPLFPYDMAAVASRQPLARAGEREVRRRLEASPRGRIVQALLDLRATLEERGSELAQADHDRVARQGQVEALHALLAERSAADAAAEASRRELLEALRREWDASARERQRESEVRQEELRQLAALAARRAEELAARQRALEEAEGGLRRGEAERRRLEEQLAEARDEAATQTEALAAAARQSAAAVAEAERLRQQLAAAEGRREEEVARLDAERRTLRYLLLDHRNSRVYRALVRLGRWRAFDERVRAALGDEGGEGASLEETWTFPRHGGGPAPGEGTIAVDLTALRPGGENGGVKVIALEMVRGLAALAPDRPLLLLTSEPCHAELAWLEAGNVRRRRVSVEPTGLAEVLEEEPVAAVFCPTTAPPWSDPRIPLVTMIHDLQHLTYPDFFDEEERGARDAALRRASRWADHVVTGSEYVRRVVLAQSQLGPQRVTAVPYGLSRRFAPLSEDEVEGRLARRGLARGRYLLYPANAWPHKNHRMLLTAFAQFRSRHPDVDLGLVLTGAERPDPAPLVEAIGRMGLAATVTWAGYVPDAELGALLAGCRALVFPSLYEGFGMPVLEAMAAGRPVLASDRTSLPEVGGDAALYFDPRQPEEIAAAIARVASDDGLVAELGARGRRRAAEIGGSDGTARALLATIDGALAGPRRFRDALGGVWADGWTPERFVIGHATPSPELELRIENPRPEAVTLAATADSTHRSAVLPPQRTLLLRCRLPAEPGYLALAVGSTFRPAEKGLPDPRRLGVRLRSCRLRHEGGAEADLLAALHG